MIENLQGKYLRCWVDSDIAHSHLDPYDSLKEKGLLCNSSMQSFYLFGAGATGFEPAILALTGPHVRPLHHAPERK